MARTKGAIGFNTRQQIRKLREIVTIEEYQKVIQNLYKIASTGKGMPAVQAAKIIIERYEGPLPKEVILRSEEGSKTIADILNDDNT